MDLSVVSVHIAQSGLQSRKERTYLQRLMNQNIDLTKAETRLHVPALAASPPLSEFPAEIDELLVELAYLVRRSSVTVARTLYSV